MRHIDLVTGGRGIVVSICKLVQRVHCCNSVMLSVVVSHLLLHAHVVITAQYHRNTQLLTVPRHITPPLRCSCFSYIGTEKSRVLYPSVLVGLSASHRRSPVSDASKILNAFFFSSQPSRPRDPKPMRFNIFIFIHHIVVAANKHNKQHNK